MAEKTFTQQAEISSSGDKGQATYLLTLPGDDDYGVIDVSMAEIITIDSLNSIGADEIEVYFTSKNPYDSITALIAGTPASWDQYLRAGTNPFDGADDQIRGIDVRGLTYVLFVRNGVASGADININVSITSNSNR